MNMDELKEMEITYSWGGAFDGNKGTMIIRLYQFFNEGHVSIPEIQRLCKYIRESNNPEELNKVQQFVEQYRETAMLTDEDIVILKKNLANKYTALMTKHRLTLEQADKMLPYINRIKLVRRQIRRGDPKRWVALGEKLKEAKEDLKETKDEARRIAREAKEAKADFESADRRKKKWDNIAAAVR